MSNLLFGLGLVIVLLTSASVLFTIVLPREPRGFERVSSLANRLVQVTFIGLSRLARTYEGKDALLAPTAPVALIAQLLFWAGGFIVGYALMLEGTTHSMVSALAQAAGAVFTVGTVDLSGPANEAVDIAAGATWVVIVALQIAYLPALYGAFNRRESLVAMLESRAGIPAWGPEVLARHQLVGIVDTLPDFYASWEEWSADLAESHTTYPVMLLFRSPQPWFSWLVGLIAVLDGAAMHLAVAPSTASSQSRLCLRMGFTALNRMATMQGWVVDPDPNPEGPIDLTFEEFAARRGHAGACGLPDGANRRGGVARLPRVAGQLRDGGLPAGRPSDRPTGPVVGHPASPPLRTGGAQPPTPALPVGAGRAPARRGGGPARPPAGRPGGRGPRLTALRRSERRSPGRLPGPRSPRRVG